MLGRVATTFGLPVVLSTVYVKHGMSGTNPELPEVLPRVAEIDRTSLNSWEDEDFRAAVEGSGRKKLILAGLWTEVCVAFPALDAPCAGYEVYVVDAIGGVSKVAHETALQRMTQAGAQHRSRCSASPASCSASGDARVSIGCAVMREYSFVSSPSESSNAGSQLRARPAGG
jgi:Isochorismatase family